MQTLNDSSVDQGDEKPKKTIFRCPKCRSINPINANYCFNCGKVFSSKNK